MIIDGYQSYIPFDDDFDYSGDKIATYAHKQALHMGFTEGTREYYVQVCICTAQLEMDAVIIRDLIWAESVVKKNQNS